MFGAFRPSAPLFGGLLWKIPYRLSRPQKLRHRRRLRKVDNVVSVLDNALRRQAVSMTSRTLSSQATSSSSRPSGPNHVDGQASPSELASTAEGRRMLDVEENADQEERRHGKGPKQGEMVPEFSEHGVGMPSARMLRDQALLQGTIKLVERWKAEMPAEQEMLPRDKYTVFSRYSKKYRKGVHKIPKWTRVSQRLNPPGF